MSAGAELLTTVDPHLIPGYVAQFYISSYINQKKEKKIKYILYLIDCIIRCLKKKIYCPRNYISSIFTSSLSYSPVSFHACFFDENKKKKN